MIDWQDVMFGIFADIEADEWPAEHTIDGRPVLLPCALCGSAPVHSALLTDAGPVHINHEPADVLLLDGVLQEVRLGEREFSVRLAGHEVGTFTYSCASVTVRVLGVGSKVTGEADRVHALLDLWGYTLAGVR